MSSIINCYQERARFWTSSTQYIYSYLDSKTARAFQMVSKQIYFRVKSLEDPCLQAHSIGIEQLRSTFLVGGDLPRKMSRLFYLRGPYILELPNSSPDLKEYAFHLVKLNQEMFCQLVWEHESLQQSSEVLTVYSEISVDGFYQLLEEKPFLVADRKIAEIGVVFDGMFLRKLPFDLQDDQELVKLAVTNNGWALRFASNNLKGSYDVVSIAVEQDGWALQFASLDLRDSLEIVKIAVSQDPSALQFASVRLQSHPEILMICEQNESFCFF